MPATYNVKQSSVEAKKYPLTYNLLDGVTLSSVTATHTLPDESTEALTAPIESGQAYVEVPTGLDLGTHYVSCIANTTDADFSPEILLIIEVKR